MGLRKHRGRGDFKGKYLGGRGRGNDHERRESGNNLEKTNDEEEQGGEFSRRKIESNAEKYDLPLYSGESSEDEEVKDFDYIKNNEAGLHSHFKFNEEKDWDDMSSSETVNFLQLDLNKLANEMNVGIYKLLQLNKIKNECHYCVESLKNDIPDHEEQENKSQYSDTPSINPYVKSFEILRDKILPNPNFHINTTYVDLTPKSCKEKKVFLKDASNQTEILSNEITDNFESISLNVQTSEISKNIIKQEVKRLSQDIDLDKLLEISENTDVQVASGELNNQEELCDWLDDLLNRP